MQYNCFFFILFFPYSNPSYKDHGIQAKQIDRWVSTGQDECIYGIMDQIRNKKITWWHDNEKKLLRKKIILGPQAWSILVHFIATTRNYVLWFCLLYSCHSFICISNLHVKPLWCWTLGKFPCCLWIKCQTSSCVIWLSTKLQDHRH